MLLRIICCVAVLATLGLTGCANTGGGSGPYYSNQHRVDPWYYRGGYARDRVHVVSETELRAIEQADAASMPEPDGAGAPDMGFGDMDMGGMDMDFD
jgi:hypothetical protein